MSLGKLQVNILSTVTDPLQRTFVQLFMPMFAAENVVGINEKELTPFNSFAFGAIQPISYSYIFDRTGDLYQVYSDQTKSILINANGKINYFSLQKFLLTNSLKPKRIRLTGSPQQIALPWNFLRKDVYGNVTQELFITEGFKDPMQVQNNIVDIPLEGKVFDANNGVEIEILKNEGLTLDFDI